MLFIELYESIMNCVIRFFDNRFRADDEVDYLRMELDKLRQDNLKLLNQVLGALTSDNLVVEKPDNDKEFQPVGKGYTPWSVKRLELERDSFMKAKQNKSNLKSISELEKELEVNNA